jgi:hypothetical protein
VFVEYADFNFTLFAALTTSCFLFDFFFIVYLIRAQKLTCLELKTYLHKVYDIIFGSFKKIIKKKRYEYMKFKNKKLNTITVFDLKDQETLFDFIELVLVVFFIHVFLILSFNIGLIEN